ncbi:pyruvate, water dikinase, partial [Dietzia aerolata]|nr:pyruvate, water dikinase [Dietzia aerolata]
ASRRRAREIADGLVAPARFRTAGGRPSPSELSDAGFVPLTQIPSAERGDVLGGIASSSGTARGVVVVVSDPADATGGIIATYRTDPGWVTALPSATALLI